MGRIEEQIADAERAVKAGDGSPDLLLRIGQLYMRADRPADAVSALEHAESLMSGVVHDAAGEIELNPLWDEVGEALTRARELSEAYQRRGRREELASRLEGSGRLELAQHDELIRLEVRDGVTIHPEVPSCPGCAGPVTQGPNGGISCARSGADGDLCRHTRARGIYACETCGLVVRMWKERNLKVDSREPPLVRPERSMCQHCKGRIASWKNHFMRCPKARPVDFPICPVCNKRGYHAGNLVCPRCKHTVAETLCTQKSPSW